MEDKGWKDKEDKDSAANRPVPSDSEEDKEPKWEFKFINGKPLDIELDDNDNVFDVKSYIANKYDDIFKTTGQSIKDINLLYKGERLITSQEFKDLEPAVVTIHIKGEFKGGGKRGKPDDAEEEVMEMTIEPNDVELVQNIVEHYNHIWTTNEWKAMADHSDVNIAILQSMLKVLNTPNIANVTAGSNLYKKLPFIKFAEDLAK